MARAAGDGGCSHDRIPREVRCAGYGNVARAIVRYTDAGGFLHTRPVDQLKYWFIGASNRQS
jgi:hypothetical protein